MAKKVGIILINYRDYAQRFLPACRDSLRTQDYPSSAVRVYIVDNASTPESREYLQANYPEAAILEKSDGNYSAACNLGFSQAIKDGADYLVGVNMDTEMKADWLSQLVLALEKNPEAGIAQSKILLYPKDEGERQAPLINSLGNVIHFLGFGFTDGYGNPDRQIDGYPEIKGYASGCSFIIKAEAFGRIGGYNEEYYMYHDDLELSLKAKLAGYKIILAPASVISHKYEFARSRRMVYYMERNRYLTLLTFYPWPLLLLIGLPGFIMDLGMLFYSAINGWFQEEIKIYGYFLKPRSYALIKTERKKIRRFKQVSFWRLARRFAGRIEFQEIANPLLRYLVNPLFDIYWQLIRLFI